MNESYQTQEEIHSQSQLQSEEGIPSIVRSSHQGSRRDGTKRNVGGGTW